MEDLFSVWTRNDNEEWLKRNAGCSDVLVLHGVTRQQAEGVIERVELLYGDTDAEIHPANKTPVAGSVGCRD